jgi:hypothetical protein
MAARSETRTITKRRGPEEPAEERFGQGKRPEKAPFRLQVDRQTKESYATFEEAEAAGSVIKKATLSFRWQYMTHWRACAKLSNCRRTRAWLNALAVCTVINSRRSKTKASPPA